MTLVMKPNMITSTTDIEDHYRLDSQSTIPHLFSATVPAFFRAWDNPHSKDEDWLNFFSPECRVLFGGHISRGHDAMRAMRAGFINPEKGPVINLQHNFKSCWTLSKGPRTDTQKLMIKSSISYLLVNGREVKTDCVSYIELAERGDGSWHNIDYEVFLASFEIMDAIKAM